MSITLRKGTLLCAAALLAIPSVLSAQDNASSNDASATTMVTNNAVADPALTDPMATDMGTANGMGTTAMPMDETLANDMALAETAQPEREDKDFPWGLLGLLGLAGLMGRNKNDDIHVDARRNP